MRWLFTPEIPPLALGLNAHDHAEADFSPTCGGGPRSAHRMCRSREEARSRSGERDRDRVRGGESRSFEQTTLWNQKGQTIGIIRGFNRTVARTAIGVAEVATFYAPWPHRVDLRRRLHRRWPPFIPTVRWPPTRSLSVACT